MVPLASPSFGQEEFAEVVKVLSSTKVTMGQCVKRFERTFADYVGCKYGIMTNSGSSALLLKFLALLQLRLDGNMTSHKNEVIVPSISWSTDYSSLWLARMKPVIVDIDRRTLSIDVKEVENAITGRTAAILAVHLLGNPCPIDELRELAEKHGLDLLEDCCEAHGATFRNRHVGSFGRASTFSFYFSHHISTIEGGMLLTNDSELADTAYMVRAHGWIRDSLKREKHARLYEGFDSRFVFRTLGLNVRPTEIQGALGLTQHEKLENFLEIRRRNATYLIKRINEELSDFVVTIETPPKASCSWFLFPIIRRDGARISIMRLSEFMEHQGVEVRPVTTGNVVKQPFFRYLRARVSGYLDDADYVTRNSFCIGVHQGVDLYQCEYVIESLKRGIKYAKD